MRQNVHLGWSGFGVKVSKTRYSYNKEYILGEDGCEPQDSFLTTIFLYTLFARFHCGETRMNDRKALILGPKMLSPISKNKKKVGVNMGLEKEKLRNIYI